MPNERNRMAEQYQNIINAIPPGIIEELKKQIGGILPEGENVFENTCINIKDLYNVTKTSLQSRHIYDRLNRLTLDNFQLSYKVLENAGFVGNDLNQENVLSWWNCLKKSDLDNKTQEFQWKLSHKALYTFIKLHEIDPEISKECILCKNNDEDLEHIFVNCTEVKLFWQWIFREFNMTTDLNEQFVYLNNYNNMTKLDFLITILGKCTIWQMRTILKNSPLFNIQRGLKINFKYKIQSHLTTLYHRYKARNESYVFELEYLAHNKIALHLDQINVNVQYR
jgi:hypothetical protein